MKAMNPLGPEHPPIEVQFAEGVLYTRACTAEHCGYENGGHILREGRKLPDLTPCVFCNSPTNWKRLFPIR